MLFIKINDSRLNGTPVILFGQSTSLPWYFYGLYSRSNEYVYGLLMEGEIVDENDNVLTLDQIHDAINNVNLTEVIQKLNLNQTFSPRIQNLILNHPKLTETHKLLIKMYSNK